MRRPQIVSILCICACLCAIAHPRFGYCEERSVQKNINTPDRQKITIPQSDSAVWPTDNALSTFIYLFLRTHALAATTSRNDDEVRTALMVFAAYAERANRRDDYLMTIERLLSVFERTHQWKDGVDLLRHVHSRYGGDIENEYTWTILRASFLQKAGHYHEAIQLMVRYCQDKIFHGESDQQLVYCFNILGQLYFDTEDYGSALVSFNRAKSLLASTEDDPSLTLRASLYHNLARSYTRTGYRKRGLRTCDEFMRIAMGSGQTESLAALHIQNAKADLYKSSGRNKRAIPFYENLVTNYPKYIPESDPVFIALLNNLAEAYRSTAEYHKAYVYLRWAYEMMDNTNAYRSPLGVDVITNLAEVYSRKGDQLLAEEHLREAMKIKMDF
jgi:tetratricopeptide (TPR) repeat protein